jgi:CRP-like cAMP-binding protein
MTPKAVAKTAREFDPNTFLATIGKGRNSALFLAKQGIFAQGDAADAVFYLQKGKVKLTVVSKACKEATIGILGEGDFSEKVVLPGSSFACRLQLQCRIVPSCESTRKP